MVTVVLFLWLQVYCKSDGRVVCPECHTPGAEHHGHDTVSLETEWMDTKVGGPEEEEERSNSEQTICFM